MAETQSHLRQLEKIENELIFEKLHKETPVLNPKFIGGNSYDPPKGSAVELLLRYSQEKK